VFLVSIKSKEGRGRRYNPSPVASELSACVCVTAQLLVTCCGRERACRSRVKSSERHSLKHRSRSRSDQAALKNRLSRMSNLAAKAFQHVVGGVRCVARADFISPRPAWQVASQQQPSSPPPHLSTGCCVLLRSHVSSPESAAPAPCIATRSVTPRHAARSESGRPREGS
jgi:hypothetical protein